MTWTRDRKKHGPVSVPATIARVNRTRARIYIRVEQPNLFGDDPKIEHITRVVPLAELTPR